MLRARTRVGDVTGAMTALYARCCVDSTHVHKKQRSTMPVRVQGGRNVAAENFNEPRMMLLVQYGGPEWGATEAS